MCERLDLLNTSSGGQLRCLGVDVASSLWSWLPAGRLRAWPKCNTDAIPSAASERCHGYLSWRSRLATRIWPVGRFNNVASVCPTIPHNRHENFHANNMPTENEIRMQLKMDNVFKRRQRERTLSPVAHPPKCEFKCSTHHRTHEVCVCVSVWAYFTFHTMSADLSAVW